MRSVFSPYFNAYLLGVHPKNECFSLESENDSLPPDPGRLAVFRHEKTFRLRPADSLNADLHTLHNWYGDSVGFESFKTFSYQWVIVGTDSYWGRVDCF